MLTQTLLRMIAILFLCLLSVWRPQSALAADDAAQSDGHLVQLLGEREKLLQQIISQLDLSRQRGVGLPLANQLQAIEELTDTQLELAGSPQERLSILRQSCARLQDIESTAEERSLAGIGTTLELLDARAFREGMSLRLAVAEGNSDETISALGAARLQTQQEVVRYRELMLNSGVNRTGPDYAGFVGALNRLHRIRVDQANDNTQRLQAHAMSVSELRDLEKKLTDLSHVGVLQVNDLAYVKAKRCEAELRWRQAGDATPEQLQQCRSEWKEALSTLATFREAQQRIGNSTLTPVLRAKAELWIAEVDDTSTPERRVEVCREILKLRAEVAARLEPTGGLDHLLAGSEELNAQIDLARAELALKTPAEAKSEAVSNTLPQTETCRVEAGGARCCSGGCHISTRAMRRPRTRCRSRRFFCWPR